MKNFFEAFQKAVEGNENYRALKLLILESRRYAQKVIKASNERKEEINSRVIGSKQVYEKVFKDINAILKMDIPNSKQKYSWEEAKRIIRESYELTIGFLHVFFNNAKQNNEQYHYSHVWNAFQDTYLKYYDAIYEKLLKSRPW